MASREEAIQKLIAECGSILPESYLNFLRRYGTMEGELRVRPFWFRIWPADEVMEANRDDQVQEYLPGWLAIGSSGGGEMLAFDIRSNQPLKVFMIPFIGMDESEAMVVAEDFESFADAIVHTQASLG
jgi:hypothetical protein